MQHINKVSKLTSKVVVFHERKYCYFLPHILHQSSQFAKSEWSQAHWDSFPLYQSQARSLGSGFAESQIGTVRITLLHSCASPINTIIPFNFSIKRVDYILDLRSFIDWLIDLNPSPFSLWTAFISFKSYHI